VHEEEEAKLEKNLWILGSLGTTTAVQRHVLKIWGTYVAELYDRTNRAENLEVESEEEENVKKSDLYFGE
jgi:hypothetical protein